MGGGLVIERLSSGVRFENHNPRLRVARPTVAPDAPDEPVGEWTPAAPAHGATTECIADDRERPPHTPVTFIARHLPPFRSCRSVGHASPAVIEFTHGPAPRR